MAKKLFVFLFAVLMVLSCTSCDTINKIKYEYKNEATISITGDTTWDEDLFYTCIEAISTEECINYALSKIDTDIDCDEFLNNLTIAHAYNDKSGTIALVYWGFANNENQIIVETIMEYLQNEIDGISCEPFQISAVNY